MEDIYEKADRLERENKELRIIIKIARERIYDAHGNTESNVAEIIRIVGTILRREKDL